MKLRLKLTPRAVRRDLRMTNACLNKGDGVGAMKILDALGRRQGNDEWIATILITLCWLGCGLNQKNVRHHTKSVAYPTEAPPVALKEYLNDVMPDTSHYLRWQILNIDRHPWQVAREFIYCARLRDPAARSILARVGREAIGGKMEYVHLHALVYAEVVLQYMLLIGSKRGYDAADIRECAAAFGEDDWFGKEGTAEVTV